MQYKQTQEINVNKEKHKANATKITVVIQQKQGCQLAGQEI